MPNTAGQPLVLVVEDDEGAREMYAASLRLDGFEVAEAGDGLEAVQMAAALRPAAVVMEGKK